MGRSDLDSPDRGREPRDGRDDHMANGYDHDTRQLITSALNATIGASCGVMLDHGDTDKLLAWLDSRGLAIGNDTTIEQQFEPSNSHSNNVTININIDGNNPYADQRLKDLLSVIHNTH